MGMFDSYNTLQHSYTPTNKSQPCRQPLECNSEYCWYYGDTVDLQFDIFGEVTVETDAIIYTAQGQAPTSTTEGEIDQKIYNTTDKKCWQLTQIGNSEYIWTEVKFEMPTWGENRYITVSDYLTGKHMRMQIFNFQHAPLLDTDGQFIEKSVVTIDAIQDPVFTIDKELSELMFRGMYYCSVTLFDENDNLVDTIVTQDDCVLRVM